jgi:small conductance mechanosensitive channel
VLGAATLAIGLALQGTLSNVAAGVMLALFRPYRIGDVVEVSAGKQGTVTDVSLFTTELSTVDNLMIIMPNAECWGKPITNFSTQRTRRFEIEFRVSYDSDLKRVAQLAMDALAADPRVLKAPAPSVIASKLGDFGVSMVAQGWAETTEWFAVKSDLAGALKEKLDAAGGAVPAGTPMNFQIKG